MRRKNRMARVLRALSGKTQEQTAEDIGVHASLIAQIELGKFEPSDEQMERLADSADLDLPDAEELFRLAETLQQGNRWQGEASSALLHELDERVESHLSRAWARLTALSPVDAAPRPEDRERAAELLERLQGLGEESRLAVVQVSELFQTWALCQAACEQSVREGAGDIKSAVAWGRLACEIAARVRGPETWRSRLQGYAAAHEASALRMAGELKTAEAKLQDAKRLWQAGSDPYGVLDSGKLIELERRA